MQTTGSGIFLLPINGVRKKMVVLDRLDGKIKCFSDRALSAGSVISYQKKFFSSVCIISEVTIEYMPLCLASLDLLFLHHVLELCYYFIPEGSCAKGVFEIIAWIYSLSSSMLHGNVKKYAVAKLLTTLGLWPENDNIVTQKVHQLISAPIDTVDLSEIHLASEREFVEWLRFCILQHPSSSKLQTMAFLSQGIR